MKKKFFPIYQLIVILGGIGIPIFIALRTQFLFPPIHEYIVYLTVALISSYLGMMIGETMISFEISIYYFLLLMFGPIIASLTAILTELIIWFYRAFSGLKTEGKGYFINKIRLGFYNAGVYGFLYMIVGIFYLLSLVKNVGEGAAMAIGIISLIILNEIFFSIYNFLSGAKFFKYLKTEGFRTDLMELGIYPFGISMYFLYKSNGFMHTIPIIIGILLLSIIGKVMSNYQIKLMKSLEDISRLNKIARNLSSILQLNTLIDTVLIETYNILKPEACSIYIKSVYDDREFSYIYDGELIRKQTQSKLKEKRGSTIIPLESGNRELGYIEIYTERKLGADEFAIVENIAEQASVSISNAMLYMISIRDPLTDLYTRRHFESRIMEEISRTDRTDQSFSLVMFDVDELKYINDTYGHKIGDEVLKKFAETLSSNSRPFDVSARWGGDEFILILPKTSEKQAKEIGRRIASKFSGKMKIEGDREIDKSCSFAVAEYEPGSKMGADEIFYKVDQKLIEVKRNQVSS
jgi:diguanylate cyclase (GGDEF)-like protein